MHIKIYKHLLNLNTWKVKLSHLPKAASTTPNGEFHELGNIAGPIGWTHGMN